MQHTPTLSHPAGLSSLLTATEVKETKRAQSRDIISKAKEAGNLSGK